MPQIARETLSKIDELLEHIDAAYLWVIKYAEEHQLSLDTVVQFHLTRIESILHEINDPFARNVVSHPSRRPPDKLPVYS